MNKPWILSGVVLNYGKIHSIFVNSYETKEQAEKDMKMMKSEPEMYGNLHITNVATVNLDRAIENMGRPYILKMDELPVSQHQEYYLKILEHKAEIERLFNEIIDFQTNLDYVPDDVKTLIKKIHQWKEEKE